MILRDLSTRCLSMSDASDARNMLAGKPELITELLEYPDPIIRRCTCDLVRNLAIHGYEWVSYSRPCVGLGNLLTYVRCFLFIDTLIGV